LAAKRCSQRVVGHHQVVEGAEDGAEERAARLGQQSGVQPGRGCVQGGVHPVVVVGQQGEMVAHGGIRRREGKASHGAAGWGTC
jgi:hypothetical protein